MLCTPSRIDGNKSTARPIKTNCWYPKIKITSKKKPSNKCFANRWLSSRYNDNAKKIQQNYSQPRTGNPVGKVCFKNKKERIKSILQGISRCSTGVGNTD